MGNGNYPEMLYEATWLCVPQLLMKLSISIWYYQIVIYMYKPLQLQSKFYNSFFTTKSFKSSLSFWSGMFMVNIHFPFHYSNP